jgi:ribosomal protein S18 acetylase RimI-like enzyme
MTTSIRQASKVDITAISRTLAKSFADDPVKLFLCGGEQLPIDKAMAFFTAFQKVQLRHGHVYTTPGVEAAAIWAPPGEWKVPLSAIVKHTPTFLKLYGRRFLPNLSVLTDLEKRHPTEPHYYLDFIGTDPAQQGKGWGTKLMQPMIERADVEGVGMYLESSKESNVPFYARFGFEVREEMQHRRNGPKQWLMWRDPVAG